MIGNPEALRPPDKGNAFLSAADDPSNALDLGFLEKQNIPFIFNPKWTFGYTKKNYRNIIRLTC